MIAKIIHWSVANRFLVLLATALLVFLLPAGLLLAAAGDWPRGRADLAAWITRDAMLPALWCAAWAGNSFEWRGNAMTAAEIAKDKP